MVVALTGLLISPISWSHHWIWLLLLPPLLVRSDDTGVPVSVRNMLWALVILAVAAPYWWLTTGAPAALLQATVPLWTGATLAVWALIESADLRKAQLAERSREPSAT